MEILKKTARAARLFINHGNDPEYLRWYINHRGALARFYNNHLGEKCFIIGNGPSLNKMDLTQLKGCMCFGLNKIYLLLDTVDLEIDYHVAVNPLVIEQSSKEFEKFGCPSFLSYRASDLSSSQNPNFFYLMTAGTPFVFRTDIQKPIFEGYTVTYVAMQLAFYMGFSEIYLIGVDHNFVAQGDPNEKQFLSGPDQNHFHPGYFSDNEWHLPDLEGSELAYRLAKHQFERSGRKIFDATVDGNLQIFPKVTFEQALTACKTL